MDRSKQASRVYDKIAELYAKKFLKSSEHIDEFLSLIQKGGKILDSGCGVGVDAGYMTSKGFEVTGIDLSKKMLRLAKQRFSQIEFRQQDIRKVDFPPNSFDGILASCSLIHIPKKDIPALLKKFYQILKKNGALYIAMQEGKSEEIIVNQPFKPDEKLFLNIISFEEIKKLLANAGFSIIKKYERKSTLKEELNFTKLFVIARKLDKLKIIQEFRDIRTKN